MVVINVSEGICAGSLRNVLSGDGCPTVAAEERAEALWARARALGIRADARSARDARRLGSLAPLRHPWPNTAAAGESSDDRPGRRTSGFLGSVYEEDALERLDFWVGEGAQ